MGDERQHGMGLPEILVYLFAKIVSFLFFHLQNRVPSSVSTSSCKIACLLGFPLLLAKSRPFSGFSCRCKNRGVFFHLVKARPFLVFHLQKRVPSWVSTSPWKKSLWKNMSQKKIPLKKTMVHIPEALKFPFNCVPDPVRSHSTVCHSSSVPHSIFKIN